MKVELDVKDLAKYPFLKESQEFIGNFSETLDRFLASNSGKVALKHASERVIDAIASRKEHQKGRKKAWKVPSDQTGVRIEIASYALARVLVSCIGDRFLIDRLTRYEALRAAQILEEDEERDPSGKGEMKQYIAESVGIDMQKREMALVQYVELVPGLREDKWRLVNRDVYQGAVRLDPGEFDELLRERIRILLHRQLPLRIPPQICSELAPWTQTITAAYQEQILEEFGTIEESFFPPCIQALTAAITSGGNLPHVGRFALTAFLHTIGMNVSSIVELYCRAPDFDAGKTLYQVEHISGRGGTEYTPPSCATMRTYGICVKPDSLCEHVNHPLSYYKAKKKKGKAVS
jgi:DNA primase large subunit